MYSINYVNIVGKIKNIYVNEEDNNITYRIKIYKKELKDKFDKTFWDCQFDDIDKTIAINKLQIGDFVNIRGELGKLKIIGKSITKIVKEVKEN